MVDEQSGSLERPSDCGDFCRTVAPYRRWRVALDQVYKPPPEFNRSGMPIQTKLDFQSTRDVSQRVTGVSMVAMGQAEKAKSLHAIRVVL
jgi:hypothetical protein